MSRETMLAWGPTGGPWQRRWLLPQESFTAEDFAYEYGPAGEFGKVLHNRGGNTCL